MDSKEDEFYWEYYYEKQIESIIFDTFQKLITTCTLSVDNSYVIDDEIKFKLAKIICSQLLRTKKAREVQFEIGKRTANNVIGKVKEQFEGLSSDELTSYLDNFNYSQKLNKEISLPIINNENRLKKLIDLLLEHNWVVYKNIKSRKIPIITSDHPVVYYNIITQETNFKNNGLGRSNTAILFPINHKLIIGLYKKDMYFNKMFKYNNKMLVIDDISFVMKLNKLQYEQCYRQAYFSFK